MTRTTIIYFCHAEGGLRIVEDDDNRPMSLMMASRDTNSTTHRR